MKNLYFHVSNKKIDDEIKINKIYGFVCVSENEFVSRFGEYIYILDKEKIDNDFKVEKYFNPAKSRFKHIIPTEKKTMIFKTAQLKSEKRIFGNINIKKYCIGIAKHFDESKDIIGEKIINEIKDLC